MKRLSIRYKFLLVAATLLVATMGVYFLMAMKVFKDDKRAFVFDHSRQMVQSLSQKTGLFLSEITERLEVTAYMMTQSTAVQSNYVENLLKKNEQIVWIAKVEGFKGLDKVIYHDSELLRTYELKDDHYQSLVNDELAMALKETLRHGLYLWTVVKDGEPPLIGIAKSVVEEDKNGRGVDQFVVVSLARLDDIYKTVFAEEKYSQDIFKFNKSKGLLWETGSDVTAALVAMAKKSPLKSGVRRLQTKEGEFVLGAYSKVEGQDLVAVSFIPEKKAFIAIEQLVKQSLIFSSIILTLAFLAAVIFSRGITGPITLLVKKMQKVAMGNLDETVEIKSSDETAFLAHSFNEMLKDLKTSRLALEKSNAELEEKVEERTRELKERNQAIRAIQESMVRNTKMAAIGEVAGQTAHEILNPLTAIINRAQSDKDKNTQQKTLMDLFDEILKAWGRAQQDHGVEGMIEILSVPSKVLTDKTLLEEDLINLSKISQALKNHFEKEKESLEFIEKESFRIQKIVAALRQQGKSGDSVKIHSISEIVKESVAVMQDWLTKMSIDIKVQIDFQENVAVNIDKDEMIQVLTNLFRNSAQALEGSTKGGHILISLKKDHQMVNISVKDNGCGIKPEIQGKIFDVNFSTKMEQDGMGIGLSLSRRLIRKYKGDLKLVESHVGKKTEFLISIPLIDENRVAS